MERRETALLLRCTAGAVAGGAILSAVLLAFLAGFDGHEKTIILAWVLAACIAGLLWFAGDWFDPREIEV